ncbi:hypothetical protein G7085_09490 [Tessaracoccus sp. HDW20]|uniref:type VII secretion protein EccB n=1 Tax=Tessaracoccus coleopterorum TaxID=2714950 RepID=UPI0018D285CB|nr:type VII secretion protein EccB [Tessaracoccus coleopterorum]NHB84765.1 hypothetical protein [Tessaracoccus coleopterorum]
MATRKDLLKAQSFTSRRMIAAFVDRDPDDPTPPLRRVGTATFVSILIGVVLLAGTTLLGCCVGHGQRVVEGPVQRHPLRRPVRALFVYQDDRLYPMADVSSARLKAAGAEPEGQPRVIEVKTEALRGQVQQPEEGIPGSPRQLPAVKDLRGYPLRLCSTAPQGHDRRYLTLEFGSGASSSNDFAIVARHSNGTDYLLFGGQTHQLYAAPGQQSSLIGDLPVVTPGTAGSRPCPPGSHQPTGRRGIRGARQRPDEDRTDGGGRRR